MNLSPDQALANDQEQLALQREAELGSDRQYSEDGLSYQLVLPDELETPTQVQIGALTWVYKGQAHFPSAPTPPTGSWTTVPDYVLTSLDYDADEYLGTHIQTRTDKYGRRWILDSIDEEMAHSIAEGPKAADEFSLEAPDAELTRSGIEYPDNAGEERYSEPTSWTISDCGSNGTNDVFIGPIDTLHQISSTYNSRMKKIVLIWGPGGSCSGVMVKNDWVLTAAHCIANSSGEFNASGFTVCTSGNVQAGAVCKSVNSVVAKGGVYDGTVENDYGLLELSSSAGVGYFTLSQAGDSVIEPHTDYNRAYPSFNAACTSNTVTNNSITVNDNFNGSYLFRTDGAIQSTPTGYIKFDTSTALRMSGGPHYYCPNDYDSDGDYCEDGTWVTAVQHGVVYWWLFGWHGYTSGPKARDMRSWVLNNAI